jgi:DNA-binding response OmpR family regulator
MVKSASPMRILIVEDEVKVADVIARGLRAEGFAVDTAKDGLAGLEMTTAFEYDLIVLDLLLPHLSGTEVLRQIRTRKLATPIIILTALDDTLDKVRHFEDGADDYLTKPFAFAELLVRIKALIRRGQGTRSSTLKVADLELDRLSRQVRRAGKRIDLTSKEYSLLEYLLSHSGRVLSRTMIVEHVWDESFEGLTNIVDVYIRYLRNKIDEGHAKKLIRTVRGVGYCVEGGE